mmetsp:Transcript_24051/g.30066  ORF Transcript_24051/g.30066 Transcript_24051/m.30066 type:complete len:246 (-) Transcript_24051:501-1238(-)
MSKTIRTNFPYVVMCASCRCFHTLEDNWLLHKAYNPFAPFCPCCFTKRRLQDASDDPVAYLHRILNHQDDFRQKNTRLCFQQQWGLDILNINEENAHHFDVAHTSINIGCDMMQQHEQNMLVHPIYMTRNDQNQQKQPEESGKSNKEDERDTKDTNLDDFFEKSGRDNHLSDEEFDKILDELLDHFDSDDDDALDLKSAGGCTAGYDSRKRSRTTSKVVTPCLSLPNNYSTTDIVRDERLFSPSS